MKKLVEFKNAKLGYGRLAVFDSLNLDIFEGDFLGIIGPNGSGKTALLRSIIGLLKPQAGQVIKDKNLRFGYCMQRQFIDTLFPFTVFEIVMMARTKVIGYLRKPSSIDKQKVLEVLDITGIRGLSRERFYNLSGGQKQRTIIARALALEPNFLILDEPTTDLDVKAEREILELIRMLHKDGHLTIALVTHELNEVINYAQKFMFLNPALSCRGEILEQRKGGVNKKAPYKIFERDELNEGLLSEIFETQINLKEIGGRKIVL
ncbi:MAG: ATP-binding cassette domain-containing protein [Candidatus Omnitrophica bacterium]|nr:ATP-binding cassette domain-containing protein [Candidatus Omnitrophota bacterium]